ncbi:MAG: DinB family protein [Flavobacteriaceae bacterium]
MKVKGDLVVQEFIEQSIFRMDESMRMVNMSLAELGLEELWKKPNAASNSIGNLLMHLNGNITQYAISSLGETKDVRQRDLEFSTSNQLDGKVLISNLEQTVQTAKAIMANATIEQLLKKRKVQGFDLTGIGIIIHVVEHLSYHTGQIAYWVKQLKNKDLKFYGGIDLTVKNQD